MPSRLLFSIAYMPVKSSERACLPLYFLLLFCSAQNFVYQDGSPPQRGLPRTILTPKILLAVVCEEENTREGGEQTMMTTIKITKLIISHIENIVTDDVQEQIKGEYSERTLYLETYEGDRYEITLWAYSPDKLKIGKKGKDDWLTPKVYKGKSMSEEEED
jgi:hypothetical protein